MKIRFFYDDVNYRLRGCKKVKKLIEKVIWEEKKIPGDLNFIFTDDNSLLEINRKFLKHNYFTDVISFINDEANNMGGEVYISVDTVKLNAKNYKVSYRQELLRVIIHGTLHLCGYDDKTSAEKEKMSRMENYWLSKYEELA